MQTTEGADAAADAAVAAVAASPTIAHAQEGALNIHPLIWHDHRFCDAELDHRIATDETHALVKLHALHALDNRWTGAIHVCT